MFSELSKYYVNEQLLKFGYSKKCCMAINKTFAINEIGTLVFGGKTYNFQLTNGLRNIYIFKSNCHHFISCKYKSTEKNFKELFFFLYHNQQFKGLQTPRQYFEFGKVILNAIPHSLPLCSRNIYVQQSKLNPEYFHNSNKLDMNKYRRQILHVLLHYNIVLIQSESCYDKSLFIPAYIVENCAQNNEYCKIVCIESEEIVVKHKSEQAANYFGQDVGQIVGYQVYLQNRISDLSNLIYTTADFFLRVIMGRKLSSTFKNITHIVFNDVHLKKAYMDMLLMQIEDARKYNNSLRILLLSNSSNNMDYASFLNVEYTLAITPENSYSATNIAYIDCVRRIISNNIIFDIEKNELNKETLPAEELNINDSLLDSYAQFGTDEIFKKLIYVLCGKNMQINYKHSFHGFTAVFIAAKLNKVMHLRTLLQLGADPFIKDRYGNNAIVIAFMENNISCVKLLNEFCAIDNIINDGNAAFLDIELVANLICVLSKDKWSQENILVFMPNFEFILKLCYVLSKKISKKELKNVTISIIYSEMEEDKLRNIVNSKDQQIIIATDIADSIIFMFKIKYIIDSGRRFNEIYNPETNNKDYIYDWTPKEIMKTRSTLVQSSNEPNICFRLIPSKLYEQLPESYSHELLIMPLEKICLTIKLISNKTITEFFKNFIVSPPLIHIYQTIEILKKIGVLDEHGDPTWLSCRLIDIPADFEIGKCLIYAIILQCLDPVLTIVSFSIVMHKLTSCNSSNGPLGFLLQKLIELEGTSVLEVNSDHLVYLRIYQQWQNSFNQEQANIYYDNENEFLSKHLLLRINALRSNLIAYLRSADLVHNQGKLCMHVINQMSCNWPLVKAALVGGMYPKLCVYDFDCKRFKSMQKKELIIYDSLVLNELKKTNNSCIPSPWILYGKETNSILYNSISLCTIVTPITVAIFGDSSKFSSGNISSSVGSESSQREVQLCVDNWISFITDRQLANLILKTRQNFYSVYKHYLKN
ncbi:benign gonial cell neoplasm protein-like, partial [Teleopsis dalmanni]|uniref:benign gonial cell neoplasm protein-like n=1 Tax=Teleopsis dalmanni TaxID=139649 RepID=UPI0018CE1327